MSHGMKSHHENDGLPRYGGRDVQGYGSKPPQPKWPKNAKVALNFVINYEEGGENCILHGDEFSESRSSEIVDAQPYQKKRNLNMESLWDYGARAGFWRLHRLCIKKKIPVTVYAVGMALERNPDVCKALRECMHLSDNAWEIASHGYRWIDYKKVDDDMEKEHIERTIKIHEKLLGKRPVGMFQENASIRTRHHVVDAGVFKYDSDVYSDDLPYWTMEYGGGRPHLIIPFTQTENDTRFVEKSNFSTGFEFSRHLKDTLKYLIEEGRSTGCGKIMTVALHGRFARPGRVMGISDFIDFAQTLGKDVWICTREQIADHWYANHYPVGAGTPSPMRGTGRPDNVDEARFDEL